MQGARLGILSNPTTAGGYHDLEAWATGLGSVKAFGIEGTGSYGAGLTRDLLAKGHTVLDVTCPNRQLRYLYGKSDSDKRSKSFDKQNSESRMLRVPDSLSASGR